MRKVLWYVLLLLVAVGASVWMLDRMGVLDVRSLLVQRLEQVPALADHVNTYRRGLLREVELADLIDEMERERRRLEAERQELEAAWDEVHAALRHIESEERRLALERSTLALEWQALGEAATLELNVSRLVELYESMRPEQVAAVAEELDDTLLIEVLLQMDDRRAANLLAALAPDRAAAISRRMVGQGR